MADDIVLPSVSSMEDLLSSEVISLETVLDDSPTRESEEETLLNTQDSKNTSNDNVVLSNDTREDILDSPISSVVSTNVPPDVVFKGWDDTLAAPDFKTAESMSLNEKEEILQASESDEPQIYDERCGSVQEPKRQQSPLKVWNEIIRQKPKGSLWKGVNRWKNSITSAHNSPRRKKEKENDTEIEEQEFAKSAICEEGEDGLLIQCKDGNLNLDSDPQPELDALKLENSSGSTLTPPNPPGFNFGQSSLGFQQVGRFSPRNINRNSDKDGSIEFFRIKPYNIYPSEFKMNESDLYHDMLRESKSFVKADSRSKERQIGTLKVEVLSCMGLPKFDRFSKPNAMAYLVCGDAAFATDYITSSLSPMWPSRSKRAVEFPLFHAFARLYLGVCNATDKDVDDYAGRAVINVASLRHGVQYDVNFPLKVSTMVYDRRPRGVIRVRFQLQWTNERSAVLSYLPWKKNDLPWVNDPQSDFVSIPCANSKALRNVAYTVHGKDFPGKFSRRAFRATTREMGLYKVNVQFVIKSTLRDTMSYKNPLISSYVFSGWMLLVYFNKINLVPSFVVSFLIIIFYCNYLSFHKEKNIDIKYKSLSMGDMFSMLWNGHTKVMSDHRSNDVLCNNLDEYRALIEQSRHEDEHHQEFPFSHSDRYKRALLGEMLVPSQTQKRPKLMDTEKAAIACSEHTDGDGSEHGKDFESGDESGDRYSEAPVKCHRPHGPEQSDEVDEKEGNAFKSNFEELEGRLHQATGNILHRYVVREIKEDFVKPEKNMPEAPTKFPNPLAALTATFLEPVMKAIEVYLFSVRASFNVFTWRDPFLSFWTLIFLCVAMVILALFPWRLFFFFAGLLGFGPQNVFLKFLVKPVDASQNKRDADASSEKKEEPCEEDESKLIFGFGKRKYKTGNKSSDQSNDTKKQNENHANVKYAKMFSATSIGNPPGKKSQDEKLYEVIVPYYRFETERLYFWPPNPTRTVTAEALDLQTKKEA